MQITFEPKFSVGDTVYGVIPVSLPLVNDDGLVIGIKDDFAVLKTEIESIGLSVTLKEGNEINYQHYWYGIKPFPSKYLVTLHGPNHPTGLTDEYAFATKEEAEASLQGFRERQEQQRAQWYGQQSEATAA